MMMVKNESGNDPLFVKSNLQALFQSLTKFWNSL